MRRTYILIPVIIVIIGSFGGFGPVYGGEPSNWAIPQQIPALRDYNITPVFISWRNSVYCFSIQRINDEFTIVLSRWALGLGWTLPKDIFTHPLQNELVVTDVLLDDDGTLHLIFFAGDQSIANIYYSQAKIWDIERPQAWSSVTIIGEKAVTPAAAQIIRDKQGNLVVVYSGKSDGNGLYVVLSDNDGATWSSKSTLIVPTNDESLLPYFLEIIHDQQDNLHAVWSLTRGGNGDFVYYAKSQNDPLTWSANVLAVGFGTIGAFSPAIAEYKNELFVVYHNGAPTTRWMRRSTDLGETWMPPARLFQHVGSNGPVSFVEDSSGQMHMFFGNRIGNPSIQGMWHSLWNGTVWTEPNAVVSGPNIDDPIADPAGIRRFDPSFAKAVVVEGNLIFLAWRTDPDRELKRQNGHWYTYKLLDIPKVTNVQPQILITPNAGLTPTVIEKNPNVIIQPTLFQEITPKLDNNPREEQPIGLLFALSIIPVITFIIVILAARIRLRS